ncbi:hypothetical protein, partial [Porticoccus sp.]|uniref:hypothetical protein n=1 Tax=Porticoccus sp. TaxID=2024853 RepID=UPI003F6A2229
AYLQLNCYRQLNPLLKRAVKNGGITFSPDEFYIWRMPILEIAHKGKFLPEGEGHIAYEDSKAHIRKSRDQLDDLCKRLMRKHGH